MEGQVKEKKNPTPSYTSQTCPNKTVQAEAQIEVEVASNKSSSFCNAALLQERTRFESCTMAAAIMFPVPLALLHR